jgi:hypothetical protein
MIKPNDKDERGTLERKIAQAMEELRQLHLKPTLDDFQNHWREKLEKGLLDLRQQLRMLPDVA